MIINVEDYREVKYGDLNLYFDRKHSFHDHFNHKRKTIQFPFHKNILLFLRENPDVQFFFTLDTNIKPFVKIDQGFLINMVSYYEFCNAIQSKTHGRIKAFLGQYININDINVSEDEKDELIKANVTEKNVIEAIKNLNKDAQISICKSLQSLNIIQSDTTESEISIDDFIITFAKFLTNTEVQSAFYSSLPRIQIDILKSNLSFLKNNLDKDETFIQNWIDEEKGKYRKQRCMIFGLEYVDPKREGVIAGKRFDILAEQDLNHHILIELKSRSDDIFKVEESNTHNGISTEYNLSKSLSRAIPQVLGYKKMYENLQVEELQKIGIQIRKPISKCIVVIGTRKDDMLWKENFDRVKSCLNGIELFTYDDLIDKIENTLENLEANLKLQL